MTAAASPARVLRYAAVGLATLAIYLAVGGALHRLGWSIFWQSLLPFGAAVAVNYQLQRAWVFQDTRPLSSTMPRYAGMITLGFAINYVVLSTLSGHWPIALAQLAAATLVVMSNAACSFYWVFFKKP